MLATLLGPGILATVGMEAYAPMPEAAKGAEVSLGWRPGMTTDFTRGGMPRGITITGGQNHLFGAPASSWGGRVSNFLSSPGAAAGFGIAGTAFGVGLGAMGHNTLGVTGAQGAALATTEDVSAAAATFRFHHASKAALKTATKHPHGLIRPGYFSGGFFGTNPLTSKAALSAVGNTAAYVGRYAFAFGGGAIGGAIGGKLGRTVGGDTGAFVGAVGGTVGGSFAGAGFASVGAAGLGAGLGLAAGAAAVTAGAAAVGYGTYATLKAGYRHRQMQKSIHTSGSLAAFYTQGAQTMRSRAVSAIHKSHLNARSSLGSEASYLHFPSKSYHSRYRRF